MSPSEEFLAQQRALVRAVAVARIAAEREDPMLALFRQATVTVLKPDPLLVVLRWTFTCGLVALVCGIVAAVLTAVIR